MRRALLSLAFIATAGAAYAQMPSAPTSPSPMQSGPAPSSQMQPSQMQPSQMQQGPAASALDANGQRIGLSMPWWFWNFFGQQAVFLLRR